MELGMFFDFCKLLTLEHIPILTAEVVLQKSFLTI